MNIDTELVKITDLKVGMVVVDRRHVRVGTVRRVVTFPEGNVRIAFATVNGAFHDDFPHGDVKVEVIK